MATITTTVVITADDDAEWRTLQDRVAAVTDPAKAATLSEDAAGKTVTVTEERQAEV